jgi:hypothetical protein
MSHNTNNTVFQNLSPEDLQLLLQEVYKLRKAISNNELGAINALAAQYQKLEQLLEYLIINMHNPEIDSALIRMLAEMLGISLEKTSLGDSVFTSKNAQQKTPEEERLEKEQQEQVVRFMIYELYKMTNPRQIAGETKLDNFISNVLMYGIKEALQYAGSFYSNKFTDKQIEALESVGKTESFADALNKGLSSVRSGGRGI